MVRDGLNMMGIRTSTEEQDSGMFIREMIKKKRNKE